MPDNITLNSPTSTGAVISTDECVINTATVHVQRVKAGFGSEGVYVGTSSDNPFPVYIQANTATIGNVVLSAGTATIGNIILSAGTATFGTVNVATGGGYYLKTSTGGAIPADTTSGLMVKYGSTPTMVLGAGSATIGTILIDAGTATIGTVILGAGTATIGTVAANFASGSGFYLKTSTGGVIPSDTTSGLAVKFVNTPTVAANFASGAGFFLKTATGGTIPADITSGLMVKFGSTPSMAISAGTATIGNIILSAGTATVGTVNANVVSGAGFYLKTSTGGDIPADTTSGLMVKFGSTQTSVLGAGTATIGVVNVKSTASDAVVSLATTQAIILNTQPSLATGNFGPKTTNITASGSTALATAAGVGSSLYITGVVVTNSATTAHRGGLTDGTVRMRHTLAANGGGFTFQFNPPWKLPGSTALSWTTTDAPNIDATIHFYSGAT